MSLVSVVIPIFNGEHFLAAAIESIRSQTMDDWELLLVDDGSHDGSAAIATRYQDVDTRIRLVSQANAGVAAARNRGAALADPMSPYLLFLDQDDLLEPDALHVLVQALEADPAAAGASGYARDIDAHGRWLANSMENALHVRLGLQGWRIIPWLVTSPTTFAVAAARCPFPSTGVVLLRSTAFSATGGFDSTVVPADDWDMWLRITSQRHIVFEPMYVLRYRWHGGNVSHQWARVGQGTERCWRKHLTGNSLTRAQRTTLWHAYQHTRLRLCRMRWQWAVDQFRGGDTMGALKQLRRIPKDVVLCVLTLVQPKPYFFV